MSFEEAQKILQNKLTAEENELVFNIIINEYKRTSISKHHLREAIKKVHFEMLPYKDQGRSCFCGCCGECTPYVFSKKLLEQLGMEEEE